MTAPAASGTPDTSNGGETASVRFSEGSVTMPTMYLFPPGILGTDKRADASIGKGVAGKCIWWLVQRTAGPHSTSLRAGSPLRCASVGMTIHILVLLVLIEKHCGAKAEIISRGPPELVSIALFSSNFYKFLTTPRRALYGQGTVMGRLA